MTAHSFFCSLATFTMHLGCVCLILLQVLFISSTLAQRTTQTAPQIVEEALKSVGNIKSNFENVVLKRERDYRNQLSSQISENFNKLFESFEDEVFRLEKYRSDALYWVLGWTAEQTCVFRLNDLLNDLKSKTSKDEYKLHYNIIDAELKQVQQKLKEGQDNVNSRDTQARQKIQQCNTEYNLRQNITSLETCVVNAQADLKRVSADLYDSLKNLTRKQFVINLATVVEKTVKFVKDSMNAIFDTSEKCYSNYKTKLAAKIGSYMQAHKINISSNAVSDVTEALESQANTTPGLVLEYIEELKAKVEEIIKKRTRSLETIKADILTNNELVVKYQNALLNATRDLAIYSNAKGCLDDAQNKFRDNVHTKSQEIKLCNDYTSNYVSVGDVNTLENQLLERIKIEGEVAVVACLTSSGIALTNNTVVCSAHADSAYREYLYTVLLKKDELSRKADVILSQINNCAASQINQILATIQIYNKKHFENCLREKAHVEYNLQIA